MISRQMLELYRLLSEENFRTARELAEELKVSTKTIRNQIKNLNEVLEPYGVRAKSKHGTGFCLQADESGRRAELEEMITSQEKAKLGIPNNTRDRVHYLAEYLLGDDRYVKLDDLSALLFISKKTLTSNLKEVEELLAEYQLKLKRKPNYGICVEGSEFSRRLCIASEKHMSYQMTASMEPEEAMISACIRKALQKEKIRLSGVAYRDLLLHVEIAILRMLGENYIDSCPGEGETLPFSDTLRAAGQILEGMREHFPIRVTDEEILCLAIHLQGKRTVSEESGLPDDREDEEVGNLVDMMLGSVQDAFQFDFRENRELRTALEQHLKPLIVRLKSDMRLENRLLKEIREQHALAYTMATTACVILNHRYHKIVKEDEIGYIALIFALALEKLQDQVQKKNVLVVCDLGKGSAELLLYRYQKEFGSYLNRIEVCDPGELERRDLSETDYIFSTVRLKGDLPVPVRKVDYFLKNTGLQLVKRTLQGRAESTLLKICQKDLFFPHVSFRNKEEALRYLCGYVQSIGLTTEAFLDSVLAREMLAKTRFGNLVAMPHPIEVTGRSPFMCAAVLDDPIRWDEDDPDSMIRIIFLVSAANDPHYDIQKFYQVTARLMLEEASMKELIRVQTYEKFSELLLRTEQAVDREM